MGVKAMGSDAVTGDTTVDSLTEFVRDVESRRSRRDDPGLWGTGTSLTEVAGRQSAACPDGSTSVVRSR